MNAPLRFVLCRPQDDRNVSAALDALRATGAGELVLVDPGARVRDRSCSAPAVRVFESLGDALAGSDIAVALTRRRGSRRKSVVFSLDEIIALLSVRRGHAERAASFVFGNEPAGLSVEELSRCNVAVSIPAAPDFPSLNLSHAVALVAWTVATADGARTRRAGPPVLLADIDRALCEIVAALRARGYRVQEGPQGMRTFLRDVLARFGPDEDELEYFARLFVAARG